MRFFEKRIRRTVAGFTMLEVLAALLIAATAVVYVVASETRSIRTAAETKLYRAASMLAEQKMAEISSGVETGVSGAFEDMSGFRWEVSSMPWEGGGDLRVVVVVVAYPTPDGPGSVDLEQVMK